MKTFKERLTEHEEYRHQHRLQEIKRMSTQLARAERYIQQIESSDKLVLRVDQYLEELNASDIDVKVLNISSQFFSERDNQLYDALINLGFVEIYRHALFLEFATVIVRLDDVAFGLTCQTEHLPKVATLSEARRHNDEQVPA